MSWMQKLYETYENCQSLVGVETEDVPALMPIYHITQQAHIEAVIDTEGKWRRARALTEKKDQTTLIPCTEKSAGVANGRAPHALFDKLKYLAADYGSYRDQKDSQYEAYRAQLAAWCESPFGHPKSRAVLRYLEKGRLMADLIGEGVLYRDEAGALPEKWSGPRESTPSIFKACAGDQADAFVRFQVVESDGTEDRDSRLWMDKTLWQSFIDYQNSLPSQLDYCYVLGKEIPVSSTSPKYIRRPGDGAKLISANDSSGFTYRGRFNTPSQAFCVGKETTEKAHNALKWLIRRQGYVNGEQVILTWKTDAGGVVDPCRNALDTFFGLEPQAEPPVTGEEFASRFRKALAGYGQRLEGGEGMCVMGMDSATPGRLSIFYYRETQALDFLARVKNWHETCSWPFWDYPSGRVEKGEKTKPINYIGAPSPEQIAKAAYGMNLSDKLKKSTVERLLPCIVDGARLPVDLVRSAVRRASSPVSMEKWEANKTQAIACALVRKQKNDEESRKNNSQTEKERWKMALNPEETDVSYLYGRLLAIAERIESATYEKSEGRQTNAERMMAAFVQHPYTTWPVLYRQLIPYQARLTPGLRNYYKKLIGEICDKIAEKEYKKDKPLEGTYLLGYFCQRQAFFTKQETAVEAPDEKE